MFAITCFILLGSPQTWASYGKFPPPVAPYSDADLPAIQADMKITFPLIGQCRFNEDYNAQRSGFKHTGIDIRAPKMTPIVAPISGNIGFKVHSFWIYGKDGYRCLGTHLNDDTPGTNDGSDNLDFMFAPNLRFGDYVDQGQFIGYVGDSGDATAPHLHFELYSPSGIRNPFDALNNALRLKKPLATNSYSFATPTDGQERFDVCKRYWNQEAQDLDGILVSKQYAAGEVIVITTPKTVRFKLKSISVSELNISKWPPDRPAAVYFHRKNGELIVDRVLAPGAI
ncbi:MAG: M23 family metallopeptidase [Armatimonadetes bacterium]|nr:M23 family metallopeptidase [Armatimonadota bacterium]